ncbi:MAG: hypothetical protein ABIH85_08695 [Candidatus Omnitrophota bacterium]
MKFDKFIKEYLDKGLLQKLRPDISAVEKIVFRSLKDLKTAKANIPIDEGIAYTVAYLAMLRAGRAYMLLKGFRPADGYQHKTVVEFMGQCLGSEYRQIINRFDRMRRKRNMFTYEVDISISKTEVVNAFDAAVNFVNLVRERLKKEDPQAHFKF